MNQIFTRLRSDHMAVNRNVYMPDFMGPLVVAIEEHSHIEEAVHDVIADLGFDSFMYGAGGTTNPSATTNTYIFTTVSFDWVKHYHERGYVQVDPRVRHCLQTHMPYVWSYQELYGKDDRVDEFLDDALRYGIASGVTFSIRDARGGAVLAFNSTNRSIDPIRQRLIAQSMSNIVLFGTYFHEVFMKGAVQQLLVPRSHGAPLSTREIECLALAARGQTTSDIAFKLGISERTVQFHFDGIRTKLGAANRQEAIAKGVAKGMIETRP